MAPPGEPQTKPRALNIALSSARGELIVVYDAEDAPSPDQLRLAASRFAVDKGIDCLQARLAIRNHDESWLSKLFAIEYAMLFDFINPGLCALDLADCARRQLESLSRRLPRRRGRLGRVERYRGRRPRNSARALRLSGEKRSIPTRRRKLRMNSGIGSGNGCAGKKAGCRP